MNSPHESILLRYLRSGSPSDLDCSVTPSKSRPIVNYYESSSGSNTSIKSPLSFVDQNFKDDVLVMDGILVDSTNSASKSFRKFRPSANLDSSVMSGGNLYNTEFCLPWEKENTESYRYSHNYQSAHGKEKRPTNRVRDKNKLDIKHFDPYYSPSSSSYTSNSSTYHSPLSSGDKSTIHATATPSPLKAAHSKFNQDLTVQPKNDLVSTVRPNLAGIDWLPLDDGIAVILPSSSNEIPSRNDVNEYIQSVLYGPRKRNRPPYTLLEDYMGGTT